MYFLDFGRLTWAGRPGSSAPRLSLGLRVRPDWRARLDAGLAAAGAFPGNTDFSAWYAGIGWFGWGHGNALALYGFWTALAADGSGVGIPTSIPDRDTLGNMKLGVSLPEELVEFADREAKHRRTTRSGYIAGLLEAERVRRQVTQYVDRHGWDVAADERAWREYQSRRMREDYGGDDW